MLFRVYLQEEPVATGLYGALLLLLHITALLGLNMGLGFRVEGLGFRVKRLVKI